MVNGVKCVGVEEKAENGKKLENIIESEKISNENKFRKKSVT